MKANFNSDLEGVAADKVRNVEIASSVGSQHTLMSNSARVERILKSIDRVAKKRSETNIRPHLNLSGSIG